MKTIHENMQEWLSREAHVLADQSFECDGCSCLPVAPESAKVPGPVGFIVTHDHEVAYVDVHTARGEQLMEIWAFSHRLENSRPVPAEYWYG